MVVIGLFGQIAAGKSVVLDEFRRLGAVTIEADVVSRELLCPGSALLAEVIEEFGEQYRDEDGRLRRGELGKLVFADPEARSRLERIVHPAMVARIAEEIERARDVGTPEAVVVEAANLIEMGARNLVDVTVLAGAPREVRLRRLMERDGLSEAEAQKRLKLHEELAIGGAGADHLIDTGGSEAIARKETERVWREIVRKTSSI